MTNARVCFRLAAALMLAATLTRAAEAQSSAPSARVPQGRPLPVLLDGRFSPGEWDDADTVVLSDSLRLLLKQVEGHVYLAVATGASKGLDLYLEDGDGRVHQLHASAQIGERALGDSSAAAGASPWRWGNHVDWIANEAKADPTLGENVPFRSRLYPADGTEFQIRRSRFTGARWRVRLDVMQFIAGAPVQTWPSGATRDPATWAILTLE